MFGPASLNALSAMITPAVLISACGTLILSTSNRLGRTVDRVRRLTERYKELEGSEAKYAHEERDLIYWQIPRISRRVRLLQRSLTAFYFAVSVFVFTSLVIGGSSLGGLTSQGDAWSKLLVRDLPVVLGLMGALALSFGSLLLIVEARIALEMVSRETRYLLNLTEEFTPHGEP